MPAGLTHRLVIDRLVIDGLAIAFWVLACSALMSPPLAAMPADGGVLVMLAPPPVHYGPQAMTAGSYQRTAPMPAIRRRAQAVARDHQLTVIDSWPMPALAVHCFLMAATDPLDSERLAHLGNDRRVQAAEALRTYHTVAAADPFSDLQPDDGFDIGTLHRVATGEGIRIAQIDTGVEWSHPDLLGQIYQRRNFVDVRPMPPERHGTAVAGVIAAAADNGVGVIGVAPGARLGALRACWQDTGAARRGTCNSFTLAKALQFALAEAYPLINLSVTGPRSELLERLLDVAVARGVHVIGARERAHGEATFPASHPGVIAVADVAHADTAATTVVASGEPLLTTVPGGRWGFLSGTSMATARVAGLAALFVQVLPDLGRTQLERLLRRYVAATHPDAALAVRPCTAVGVDRICR